MDTDTPALFHSNAETESTPLTNELFEQIYVKYCKRIYAYFLCRTGNEQNAEDLTADLFLKVLNQYERYDENKLPFEIWLFKLAKNTAIDFYRVHTRKKAGIVNIDDTWEMIGAASPEVQTLKNERSQILKKAISQLPEKYRKLVSLKYAAGFKNTEIAVITGMSDGNIGVAMHRALEKLRKILTKMEVDWYE